MDIALIGTALVTLGVLGTAVTYGTDTFAGVVWNSALGKLDERELTKVSGWVHHFGDKRLPIPGAIGAVAVPLAAVVGWIDGDVRSAILRTIAAILSFAWLAVYAKVAKPINERFSAAAAEDRVLDDARAEHAAWNRVIPLRIGLLGAVLVLLVVSLI